MKLLLFFPSPPLLLIFCLPSWPELVVMEMSCSLALSLCSQLLSFTPKMPLSTTVTLLQHVFSAMTTQGQAKWGQLHSAVLSTPSVQVIMLWIFQYLTRALGTTGSTPLSQGSLLLKQQGSLGSQTYWFPCLLAPTLGKVTLRL